ncbi:MULTISPECIES: molybdenum cofactor biosynthesis protein MoaE [Chitinibacter]|uniref:molybdenum cofactor biosynthesis protein MoaE n=1 Tax=Chitinibacter TaxID=230666 RepID=UPI000ADF087C|nr:MULTISPECIES: molybdenum cofactor biosynthesis protein MoaE [Chitinibacter]
MTAISISVREADFDLGQEYAELIANDTQYGAVAVFVGRVREGVSGHNLIQSMTLEYYPAMTEKSLHQIAAQAAARWPLAAVRIIHRVGRLLPGEQIVLVLTLSAHRQAAYDANRFVMDYLKTIAPFWKYEEGETGGQWVDAREADQQARQRWENIE